MLARQTVVGHSLQAAPFVAGAALALRNLYPTLSAIQIKNAIIDSATKATRTSRTVGKIIDVQAALAAAAAMAGQAPPLPQSPSPSPPSPKPPVSPSPDPNPEPGRCTPADCAGTDLPVCDPTVGCVPDRDPGTCSARCEDEFDPDWYDQYCNAPCRADDPNDCRPTPRPKRTSCSYYGYWGKQQSGLCDGEGVCAGECLDNNDCKAKNSRKPFCFKYDSYYYYYYDYDASMPSECAEVRFGCAMGCRMAVLAYVFVPLPHYH